MGFFTVDPEKDMEELHRSYPIVLTIVWACWKAIKWVLPKKVTVVPEPKEIEESS